MDAEQSKAPVWARLALLVGVAAVLVIAVRPGMAEGANKTIYLKYAAKFTCEESLPPGAFYYGPNPPVVRTATTLLVQNPNTYAVPAYTRAVRAAFPDQAPPAPGAWSALTLGPDNAVTMTCDDIAKMLTGNPAATFIGTYGIGVKVEGYVVLGVPAVVVKGVKIKSNYLDVFAEYEAGSEVLKKDITYQPFWSWWWWPLPWRLGYPYERELTVASPAGNIDYRGLLYEALSSDAAAQVPDPEQRTLTLQALSDGLAIDPTNAYNQSPASPPALIALLGPVRQVTTSVAAVTYVLVSNKGATDPDPRTGVPALEESVPYPWVPGHLYNLPVVMPQNQSIDLDAFVRAWPRQQWLDAGGSGNASAAMAYYLPWWCGWNFWWGFDGSGCGEIGVGGGQSLDVEPIGPRKVSQVISVP